MTDVLSAVRTRQRRGSPPGLAATRGDRARSAAAPSGVPGGVAFTVVTTVSGAPSTGPPARDRPTRTSPLAGSSSWDPDLLRREPALLPGPAQRVAGVAVVHADRAWDRTVGALVATCGPVAVTGLLLVVAYLTFTGLGWPTFAPSLLELVTVPLSVLGAGLLGVMVARWLPWPGRRGRRGGLVAAHMTLPERWTLLGSYVEFARYGDAPTEWAGVIDGSRTWHVVYLLALCAMAATGALLADARHQQPVLALGGALTALALFAGWAQLP